MRVPGCARGVRLHQRPASPTAQAPTLHSHPLPLQVNLKAPAAVVIAEVVPVLAGDRTVTLLALAVVDAAALISVKARGLQVRSIAR